MVTVVVGACGASIVAKATTAASEFLHLDLSPYSAYRVNTWKASLEKEWQKARDSGNQRISEEIDLFYQKIQSQLKSVKEDVSKEIEEKNKDFANCHRELDQCGQDLEGIQELFQRLFPK